MNKRKNDQPEDRTRPYERCFYCGPGALTDEELLAVIFRTGTGGRNAVGLAQDVFRAAGEESGLSGLHSLTVQELMQIPGIGKVKAIQVMAVCELAKRMAVRDVKRGPIFNSTSKVASYYMESLRHRDTEAMLLLMLDNRCRLIREETVSTGTATFSSVSVREMIGCALRHRAIQIILVHNHPSGDPQPSDADREITKETFRAGKLTGIRLADHIIIGDHRYYSFLENDFFEEPDI